jgi:hypothetical protein
MDGLLERLEHARSVLAGLGERQAESAVIDAIARVRVIPDMLAAIQSLRGTHEAWSSEAEIAAALDQADRVTDRIGRPVPAEVKS